MCFTSSTRFNSELLLGSLRSVYVQVCYDIGVFNIYVDDDSQLWYKMVLFVTCRDFKDEDERLHLELTTVHIVCQPSIDHVAEYKSAIYCNTYSSETKDLS